MGSPDSNLTSHEPVSQVDGRGPEAHARERLPLSSSFRAENPPWKLLDVLFIAAFGFVALVIFGTLALMVAHSLPRFHNLSTADLAQNAFVLVPAQTVAYLLLVAFMVQVIGIRSRGGRLLWDRRSVVTPLVQSVPSATNQDFLTAVSWNPPRGSAAMVAVSLGIALAFSSMVFTDLLSRWVPKSLPIDKFFRDTSSTYLLAIFGVVIAPFVEELFFRGLLYPALARYTGVGGSIALTAAAFAVVHQEQLAHAWVPLAWLFLFGIVQGVVRARTRSLVNCVLIHTVYNATHFVIFFVVTEGFRHLERAT
ncbi:MAG TPA: CPBP family intramembrane glutamic endopeptidase [Candidatus Angelobacter sp.]